MAHLYIKSKIGLAGEETREVGYISWTAQTVFPLLITGQSQGKILGFMSVFLVKQIYYSILFYFN